MKLSQSAWTGGQKPATYSTLCRREKYFVSEIFRDHMVLYKTRWGKVEPWIIRTFWQWARYDAHEMMKREKERA